MKRTLGILSLFSLALLGSASVTPAQKIKPTDKQISIKWGQVSEDNDYDVVVIGGTPAGVAAVFLVGCGESSSELLLQSVVEGNVKAVKQHLAAGTDVDAKDYDGMTPLAEALGKVHKEVAELLIAKGADVNAMGKDAMGQGGYTPLDTAIGMTPLGLLRNKPLHPETADLLRKHGAKTGGELWALMPRLMQHGRFAFSFDAKEGRVYEVQDSFDLLNWEVIKTYTGTGTAVRFDEERDHDPPKWFYRVRVVE